MASFTGQGNTTNVKNFVGPLFYVTPADTPFLSMIGGLNGGKSERKTKFTWQTADNDAASQDTKTEGADATFSGRDRTEFSNVLQIHQEAFELSYTVQAAIDELSGEALLGNQPVKNEQNFQARLKLEKIATDVEFSFLQGTLVDPADPTSTARQTEGLQSAITTNAVAAGTTDLSDDHVDELFRALADVGAPLRRVVAFNGSFNRQRWSEIYGYAPEHRNIGGLSIKQVETDFGFVSPVFDRHMPNDEVYVVDVTLCNPVMLPIPRKGHFFVEPLSKTGSADKWQYYGEIGLEYGPEQWHGKITGTTTS